MLYRAILALHREDVGGMDTKRTVEITASSLQEAERELEGAARRGGFSAYRIKRVIAPLEQI